MAKPIHERIPSPAKAAVAQQKPRDAAGRFLSGVELEQYRAQQQQVQQSSERERLNKLFGRSSPTTPAMPSPSQTQVQQEISSAGGLGSNFAAIIAANKPKGMAGTSDLSEQDKWAVLLGKKRRGLQ